MYTFEFMSVNLEDEGEARGQDGLQFEVYNYNYDG